MCGCKGARIHTEKACPKVQISAGRMSIATSHISRAEYCTARFLAGAAVGMSRIWATCAGPRGFMLLDESRTCHCNSFVAKCKMVNCSLHVMLCGQIAAICNPVGSCGHGELSTPA